MAFRLVSDSEAKDIEQAKAHVIEQSGGAVVPTGKVELVSGGFWVEVYSTDGHSVLPNPSSLDEVAGGEYERAHYESLLSGPTAGWAPYNNPQKPGKG